MRVRSEKWETGVYSGLAFEVWGKNHWSQAEKDPTDFNADAIFASREAFSHDVKYQEILSAFKNNTWL
jgi:hypothetical protein